MILQGPTAAFTLEVDDGRATLRHDRRRVRSWRAVQIESLTTRTAEELDQPGKLLVIDAAAPKALDVLRARDLSFVTRSGEWHVVEPPDLALVRPADRAPTWPPSAQRPLSRGTARVARWLLLNGYAGPTITGLAADADVSEATASRAIVHLAERALVEVHQTADARQRAIRVTDPAGLLRALATETSWARAKSMTWDIGATQPDQALAEIRRSAFGIDYGIGGLAGAALHTRTAEPATVTIWIPESDVGRWMESLLARPARTGAGTVVARIAPDPRVLRWADEIDGLCVADPVQLYIDCFNAGERALDATEAMAELVLGS